MHIPLHYKYTIKSTFSQDHLLSSSCTDPLPATPPGSEQDQKILFAIAEAEDNQVKTIKEKQQMEDRQFSPYRDKLIKKGLLSAPSRGTLEFILPLFRDYVLCNYQGKL